MDLNGAILMGIFIFFHVRYTNGHNSAKFSADLVKDIPFFPFFAVALYMSAWIEMRLPSPITLWFGRRTLHECVN